VSDADDVFDLDEQLEAAGRAVERAQILYVSLASPWKVNAETGVGRPRS